MKKIGIIGLGTVGNAFSQAVHPEVEQVIVDPLHTDLSISDLYDTDAVFLCFNVPTNEQGKQDTADFFNTLSELYRAQYEGVIVIRTTLLPDVLMEANKYGLRIVYMPEFLREETALENVTAPDITVFGHMDIQDGLEVFEFIRNKTQIDLENTPYYFTDLKTASMIKYTINAWLATKVVFFNELYKLYDSLDCWGSWEHFTDILSEEGRIGWSHMRVPGPDLKFGYGGKCFPKDVDAFVEFAQSQGCELELLDKAARINKEIRE